MAVVALLLIVIFCCCSYGTLVICGEEREIELWARSGQSCWMAGATILEWVGLFNEVGWVTG